MTSSWESQVKAQIKRRYAVQAEAISKAPGNGAEKAIEAGYPSDLIKSLRPALTASYSGCGYLFEGLSFKGDETVIDLGAGAGLDEYLGHLLDQNRGAGDGAGCCDWTASRCGQGTGPRRLRRGARPWWLPQIRWPCGYAQFHGYPSWN